MIPFSDEELKPVVEKTLEKVAPMLALDGKVFVRLKGACIGCSASGQTLKYGVERQLRIDIHPEIEVINIAEGMEHMIDELAGK